MRLLRLVVYLPVALVVAVALAAGIAVLVRRLRGRDSNPFIEDDRK